MIHRLPPEPSADHRASALSRAERAAATRRARARRHYERARSQPAQRSRRTSFALLGAAALALGLASAGALEARLAERFLSGQPIAAVRVVGNARVLTSAVLEAAGLGGGTDAGALELASLRAALEQHPWIANARAKRLPTRALVIAVEERIPHAIVRSAASLAPPNPAAKAETSGAPTPVETKWTLVDASAQPIEAADPSAWPDLPRLRASADEAASASLEHGLALAARLPATGLADPGALEIEWDEHGEAGWIVHCNSPASPDAPPLDLWLGDASDDVLTRLSELLASAPALRSLVSIGDLDHQDDGVGAQRSAPTASDAHSEESDALPQKNRVRVDLRFEGRAIFSLSDPMSPADA